MNHRAPAKAKSDPVQRREEPQQSRRAPFPIVGVGASAGGLEAFTQLLKGLPSRTGMAYVLVQHLDPTHESALTELLARATEMPVRQVTDAMPVDPNRVYVIPPNVDMVISQGILRLTPRTETRGHHMPIDRFLRSLAEDKGSNAIGVILSGTASDGTLGLAAIKGEGALLSPKTKNRPSTMVCPRAPLLQAAWIWFSRLTGLPRSWREFVSIRIWPILHPQKSLN